MLGREILHDYYCYSSGLFGLRGHLQRPPGLIPIVLGAVVVSTVVVSQGYPVKEQEAQTEIQEI